MELKNEELSKEAARRITGRAIEATIEQTQNEAWGVFQTSLMDAYDAMQAVNNAYDLFSRACDGIVGSTLRKAADSVHDTSERLRDLVPEWSEYKVRQAERVAKMKNTGT